MAVSVQGFTTLVENQVAAIQGACKTLLDFTIGSILRAFVEAVSAIAVFLQAQALQVAALTRAATSYGTDLDSWGADFDFVRLPAVVSTGYLTFARFTATAQLGQANLPVGTIAQSFDGSQQFVVIADTTNPAYNPATNSYALATGSTSLSVLAQSVTAGSLANVAPGTVTAIVQGVSGFNTVTNPAAFAGGADAESDPAFRARFVQYLASLSKGTTAAVRYAIATVPGVTSYTVTNNQTILGATQYGYFYVVADNGTGMPGSTFLNAVYAAIDLVMPIGTYFNVIGPSTETANIALTIATASGYTHSAVATTVQAAITAYVAALPIGASLPYSRLAQIAYDASPGVVNVTGVTLNGGTSDIAATSAQRVILSSVTVS